MADNPRELIRAAQAAELQGDMTRAADCLEQAAALYQQSGHTSRASQLLRQARQLKSRSPDVSPSFAAAMAGGKDAMAFRSLSTMTWSDAASAAFNDKAEAGGLPGPSEREAPGESGAQRSSGRHEAVGAGGLPHPSEPPAASGSVGLPPLAERIAAVVLEGSTRPSGDPADIAAGGSSRSTERAASAQLADALSRSDSSSADQAPQERSWHSGPGPFPGRAEHADSGQATGPLEHVEHDDSLQPGGLLGPPEDDDVIVPGGLLRPPDEDEAPETARPAHGRRREKRLIERGPTRADPALDAWCSFCCRPRGEVGDLVAGPAGAFICKGCLGESQGLLGDVVASPRARKPVEDATAEGVEMLGHDEVRTLLARTLQAGARCMLLVGPEGCGKSIFFQSVQRRGQGVLTSVETLESAPGADVLLVEDVDRLESGAQAALVAFLASHPERAVVMSARGAVSSLGLWVRGEGGSLPVPTTAGLMEAVQGSLPVALLERVQVLLPVRRPTVPELVEVARRSLALRRPAVSLSEEVLGAFAAEAVRSPRAGHELRALLSRVYAGSWSLEAAQTPAPSAPAPHPGRGGRKGAP
ncbi:ClpX C4-type zinc finger protein [Corallococcus sp. CA047B]|uniref:ClpX C4-type zinc finger protein n=1 Tax=Corallococcus sp. CA047B TaxID=2316729 RepID=UPI001F32109A|nr:ClpX C4-type zinc finger protein [Corallococcus sp. CA047B]